MKGPTSCVVNGSTVVDEIWQGDCYLMGRFTIITVSLIIQYPPPTHLNICITTKTTATFIKYKLTTTTNHRNINAQGVSGEPQQSDGWHHSHSGGEFFPKASTFQKIQTIFQSPHRLDFR